jgi:hypothetical protein
MSFRKTVLSLALLLLASMALAQNGAPVAIVNSSEPSVIFSNLGPTGNKFRGEGYIISGPQDDKNSLQWIAAPFTPQTDSSVTAIQVAAFYYNSGPNAIVIALYSDADGLPGAAIRYWTVQNLPTWGVCCPLITLPVSAITVTAGTQYWVAAQTNELSEASDDVWAWNWLESIGTTASVERGHKGWRALNQIVPAFAVYGPPE